MLWRMSADLHDQRIGSMAYFRCPQPVTRVSVSNVFGHPKSAALTALTLRTGSVLGRELAPDQRRGEVAPGEGHLLDVGAGHGVDAMADRLATQPFVEEARRIVGQHPQHRGVAAVGPQLAEQRVEQPPAQAHVLKVGLDMERGALARPDLATACPERSR